MKNNYISQLHFISKHLVTLLVLALLVFGAGSVSAQAVGDYGTRYTGTTVRDWNTAANWVVCVSNGSWAGATNAVAVPTNTTKVWIRDNSRYSLSATSYCSSLTIEGGGNLTYLTITGYGLTVSGAISINAPTSNNISKYITVGTGTLTASSVTMSTTTDNSRDSYISISTGTVNVSGNITMNGSAARNQIVFADNGTLNISQAGTISSGTISNTAGSAATLTRGTVNYNGSTQTIGDYNYYNLSLSGSGAKTLQTNTTTIGGNLTLSGTASTTTVVGTTISGNLIVGDGTTFNAAGYNLTVNGTTTIGDGASGTLTIGAYSGTKIFKGLLSIKTGGTWDNSTTSSPVTFQGGINNNGTFTAGNAYTYTFDTNAQSLMGNLDMADAAVTITGITLTNNGSLSLTANLLGTGTLSNATTGTINFSGNQTSSVSTLTNQGIINIGGNYTVNTPISTNTGTINVTGGIIASLTNSTGGTVNISALSYNINTLTATASGNTVNYNGAGDQAIKNVTYSNLTLSGSGTKTFTTATTINNNFTINTGAVANLSNLTHTANAYYLNAVQQYKGSWGSSASNANNFDDTNFALPATGILNANAGSTPPVPAMWYKADIGPNTTTNGIGITTWSNQSGSANNATSQNTAPTYQTLGWNFNPSVSFSAGYFLTTSNNIFDDMTFFGVFNTTQTYTTNSSNAWACPTIIGGEANGAQSDYFLSLNEGKPFFKAFTGDSFGALSPTAQNDGKPKIISATRTKSTSGTNYIYINGIETASGTSDNTTLSSPTRLGIGNHFDYQASAQFNGGISEIIGNNSVLTTSDRQNFESYLAIKYGITLTHDYTNSVSTSIYPIAGYSNDIAGLGRNDTWKLHQKVSASSNMTSGNSRIVMATSNDFVSSNVNTPSRTALTNGQYLIWGHNNGSTSTWTAIGSTPKDSIVSRVWKVVNTGSVGSVYFQIDLTGYTSENGIYRLLVDDNTDFTTGVTSYTLTKTSGNLYTTSTPVNFASGVRYFTIAQKSNFWKGTSTSTDWGTVTNWTAGEVPPTDAKVEYATVANYGIEAANNLVLDLSERKVSRVINATTWNLTIPAGKALTVNNSIIITDKNPDRILIQTRTATPEVANGSLIFHNNTANPVYGTVEMYSKSYIDNSATDDNQKYFWQYFGIPVESITAEPTLYGAYVRKSNEAGTDTDDANYYWTELTNSSTLNAFEGFEICQPVATTYTFKGQLVNRSLNLASLPYTIGAFYPGEHLLANPYTAAIDVNKMNFGSNVEAAVYLYNTGSYGQWNAATDFGDKPGQYQSIPKEPAGNNSLPREVPSMSSMLIKVTDANNTGVSFNYSDVIKKNESIQRVKSIDAISNTDLVSTMIDLTGKHYSDRMWIFTEPSCTRNFDNGWDGRKMLGSSLAPQIYAIEPDGDYQVNSISDMNNTDLAFQAGDEVEYTIKFTHENIQRQYAGVYLVDLVENKTVDVSENGSTYTFATAQSDAPAKRFKILTRPYEKGAPDKEALVKIFTAPGRVFVQNLSTFKGKCTLYDIAGRAIKNAPFEANAVTEVLSNLIPGAYVVNTITNGEKVSKRVIVQ